MICVALSVQLFNGAFLSFTESSCSGYPSSPILCFVNVVLVNSSGCPVPVPKSVSKLLSRFKFNYYYYYY